MKKFIASALVILPLTTVTTGCVVAVNGEDRHSTATSFEEREQRNKKKIAQLTTGIGYSQVLDMFGIADFNETYQKNGEQIQVLFYRTNRKHKDDLTTKDECTPLIFKGGALVAWGDTAYNQL